MSVKKSQKFYNEILGLDIFSPSLKEKISPESLFRKITRVFFVNCQPEIFDGQHKATEQN